MAAWKATSLPATDGAAQGTGSGNAEGGVSDEEVQEVAKESFPAHPARPKGCKATKADAMEQGRRDSILKTQARATEQMAAANLRKAEAMADHAAMSLFCMPIDDLDDQAREYFQLRRKEELERIKWHMESEKRSAKREKLDHEKLVRERSAEVQTGKKMRVQGTHTPANSQPRPTLTTPVAQSSLLPSLLETTTCVPKADASQEQYPPHITANTLFGNREVTPLNPESRCDRALDLTIHIYHGGTFAGHV